MQNCGAQKEHKCILLILVGQFLLKEIGMVNIQ